MLFGPYWLLRRIGLGDLAEVFVATRTRDDEPTAQAGAEYADAGQGAFTTTDPPSESSLGSSPGVIDEMWHRHADKPVPLLAVKRISREMSRYSEVFELFAQEGELASRFDHPKVVRVFDVGDVGGRPYIAMEYVPGADLARLRERMSRVLDPGPAVKVVLDLCEALSYVHDVADDHGHSLEVVHGDVTPSNILVSTHGEAKLIDFSVASSSAQNRAQGSGKKTVRGTYAYMSPEQVRGEAIDRRTDVFAVGVVLWEGLTGRRLFRRHANYLTLTAVVEDEAPRLADLDIELERGVDRLDSILARALAKDRDRRYPAIPELAADLRTLAEELDWDLRSWTLQTAVRQLLSA
ncbi:MAG: serine/threonine-protein kinase [Myxococcota bacterium]